MRPAVIEGFHGFSVDLEGRVPFMYLCSEGFVTTGVGNLIEPRSVAEALPFVHAVTGRHATRAEIAAAWNTVKLHQGMRKGGGAAFESLTDLRLRPEAIDALVSRTLGGLDKQLGTLFPCWDEWPADAQLFAVSWAWAVGAGARYPRMIAHLRAGDFLQAADEATINPQRGTIITRNARNRVLLRNAAVVAREGLDPTRLYWPADLMSEAVTAVDLPNPPSRPTTLASEPEGAA